MTATQPTHELFRPPRMLGMTAWHIWTHQARTVDRRGLRTSKPGFSALCREVKSQTIGCRFRILRPAMQAPGTAHAQLRVLKPQRNSRPWITAVFVAFAEKGLLQRKAISRRPQAVPQADRPYLPPRAPVVRQMSTPRTL